MDGSRKRIHCFASHLSCGERTDIRRMFDELPSGLLGPARPGADRARARRVTSGSRASKAELGLGLFPTGSQEQCALDTTRPVAVGSDASLSILSELRSALPTGSGALVGALEQLAAQPGKLGDAALDRALVLLTEGDDVCSGATGEEAVRRASAAVAALRDLGVLVYPIRVGAAGNTPEQADAMVRDAPW